MTEQRFTKAGFIRTYAVPVLLLLLIPTAGWLFATHAVGRVDARVRANVLGSIARDTGATADVKAEATAFWTSVPASRICSTSDAELDRLREDLGSLCSDYSQLFWIRRLSVASIAIGASAFLFALLCVALSLSSQRALHVSFMAGWHVLKIASLLQVIAHGIIAVGLSYWVTVLWFERYVPKLIFLAGASAAVAVWLIVKAILHRADATHELEGTIITEQAAPRFWQRIRDLCGRMQTEPPAQVIAGIDDNFFVTEHPVSVDGRMLHGRTLYVSLPLLKCMEKQEADAVLAHEMAHFSGQDTLYSKKMSPALTRYVEYLRALDAGLLTRPVFYFMLLFWSLFQLSISRMSRLREFRADALAAEATSPAAMGRSLLKVVAYSSYRARVEHALFEQQARQEVLGIAGRVAAGFAAYASSSGLRNDLEGASFPHPFDTHPSLEARLAAVRAPIIPSQFPKLLLEPVADSWLSEIDHVADVEAGMWAQYEARFASAHEESLAWRYRPDTAEERALVEKHFPAIEIRTKNGDAVLRVTYAEVSLTSWGHPVAFGDIAGCAITESLGRTLLRITLVKGAGPKSVDIRLGAFADGDEVANTVQRYYARHQVMTEYLASAGAADGGQAAPHAG